VKAKLALPDIASSHASQEPLVVIEASSSWTAINLQELWTFRELLYFLIWRDVKVRYKQAGLGVAWAIIQPLFTMLIFTLFFGKLARLPSDGVPYPLFAYAGLLPWTFFANSVSSSSNSVVNNANLVTRVYFPRTLVPAASVGAGLVDFLLGFVVLIPMMIYYGVVPGWSFLMFPVLTLLTTLLALGVGLWLSAVNVKYRDVRFVVPFLLQLWMFLSPVIYPASFLPARLRYVLSFNPMSGLITAYRSSLFGVKFDWPPLALSVGIILVLLAYAYYVFRRMERTFADVI